MRQLQGTWLQERVKREALAGFVYRLTTENGYKPGVKTQRNPGPATVPALTDAQWLACTWFWVRKDGKLAKNRRYCETRYYEVKP